jgi:Flp pilus assembly protein TadG
MTKQSSGPQHSPRHGERGQTILFVVLFLSFFLIAAVGFAVDFANVWFHRQLAQNAADAACTAAAMDMLTQAGGGSAGGFTKGTPFDCATTPSAAPCRYASLNGYSGTGLVAGTPSSSVAFTFSDTIPGVPASCAGTPPLPTCSGAAFTTNPFIQVKLVERLRLFFSSLISGSRTTDVGAHAACGVVLSNSPVPIVVLNPTASGALSGNGAINITIIGGPQRGIHVNSTSGSAVSIAGGSGSINLAQGGPNQTGSDFAVGGSQAQAGIYQGGTTGTWLSPAGQISDPFALVPFPSVPPAPVRPSNLTVAQCPSIPCAVPLGTQGCQDAAGCLLYTGGLYTSDITSFKKTLIFDPGVYYMQGNLNAAQQSCLRPSTGVGNGSGGTMFYFSGNHTLSVSANGGSFGVCGSATKVPLSQVQCITSGPGTTVLPTAVVAAGGLSGNVLLGPCQAPTSGGTNYGDPLGVTDPLGMQRGMLFFQDRSANLAASGNQPSWGGGGSFGLAGFMYFHYCNSANGAGLGTNCSASAYTTQFSLQGGSCSSSFVIGETITDKLSLGGNPCIEMDLNPGALFYVLKATLVQ